MKLFQCLFYVVFELHNQNSWRIYFHALVYVLLALWYSFILGQIFPLRMSLWFFPCIYNSFHSRITLFQYLPTYYEFPHSYLIDTLFSPPSDCFCTYASFWLFCHFLNFKIHFFLFCVSYSDFISRAWWNFLHLLSIILCDRFYSVFVLFYFILFV